MAEQRQPFRFWFQSWTNPTPVPTRPAAQPQTQSQPTIPIQRPRLLPPTQLQAPSRTQSQPSSPSRTTSQSQTVSRTASQPPSPSRTARQTTSQPSSPSQGAPLATQMASQPSSPTRVAPQTTSKLLSPSRAAPQATRVASQPSSPTPVAPVTTRTASQPSSPSRAAPQATQTVSQPSSPTSAAPLTTRTASQPSSPLRAAPQATRTASQPSSPTPAAPPTTQTVSQPSPPSRAVAQATRMPSQPSSPLRAAPQATRTASQPSSPTPAAPPTTQMVSQPSPPSRAVTQATRMPSQPASPTPLTLTTQTTSQPSSPSRAGPRATRLASQPPSPSQTTRAASQPPSPLGPDSESKSTAQTTSLPPSPSRTTSKTQTEKKMASQSPSGIASISRPSSQRDSKPPSPSRTFAPQAKPSSPKEAQTQAISSQPPPQKPQSKTENQRQSPTELISSPAQVGKQPTMLSDSKLLVKSTSDSASKVPPMSQSLDVDATTDSIGPQKSEIKPHTAKDEKPKTKTQEKQVGEHNPQGNGMPKDKTDVKFLDMESSSKPQVREQLEMPSRPATEMAILRTKMTEKQSIGSARKSAAMGATEKESKISTPTNQKENKITMPHGERGTLQKDIGEGVSKFVHKLAAAPTEYLSDKHPVSVVTLAGENKGATMNIGSKAPNRDGSVQIHRGYKLNKDDKIGVEDDREGQSEERSDHSKNATPEITTCINSNMQSINNSVLYSSSCTERNPGVHLNLSTEPATSKEKMKSFKAHKAEYTRSPTQRVVSEPTVRRRCLRGLFMEPSDSDPDNPQKPRRHGCRYSCGEKEMSTVSNGKGSKDAKEDGSSK